MGHPTPRDDRFDALLSEMRSQGDGAELPPLDDLQRRRLARQAAQASLQPQAEQPTRPGRWRSAGVIAVGLAAAVMLLIGGWWLWRAPKSQTSSSKPESVASGEAQLIQGAPAVRIGGSLAHTGQTVRAGARIRVGEGQAGLRLPMGSTLLLGASTDLRLRRLQPGRVQLQLTRGTLLASVTRRKAGQRFEVHTPAGRIMVRGTVFHVEVREASSVVSVIRGRVLVQAPGKAPRPVVAGQTVVLGRGTVTARNVPNLEARVRRLEKLVGQRVPAVAQVGAMHHRGAAAPSPTPRDAMGSDPAAVRSPALLVDRPRPAPPRRARPAPPVETAASLLARAQKRRAARDWKTAVDLYIEVTKRYPSAPQAAVAHIAIGLLCLGPCKRPSQALRAFDAYLKRAPKGGLAPEALLGRARALRRLGRVAQERVALRLFLQRHPRSLHAAQVRKRLRGLQTKR